MKFIKWLCNFDHYDNYRVALQLFTLLLLFVLLVIILLLIPLISVPIIFIVTIVLTYFKYEKDTKK